MLVLGLGGKPHSGKTVAANIILRSCSGVKIYSISDLICAELGLKRENVKNPSILQDHGTLRRQEDELYWIKRTIDAIQKDQPEIAIIPNIRMLTEVAGVRKLGGILVRYERLDLDGTPYISHDRDMNHHLETALDDFNWDYYITTKSGERALVEMWTLGLVSFMEAKVEKAAK